MASPWDAFPEVSSQQQGGGVILTDPYQARGDQRAEEDQGMQREKLQVDVGNTGFNQRDKLRSDYNALPAVKEYRVGIQALAASLKRGNDGSGDTALIYDYVKALDPTSVVREAEVGMAASGASTVEAAAAKLKKEFGIDGGGNLPPEVRNRLRREIITSTIPRVKQYNQLRGQFEELAKRNNFDPYEIVGDHDADPYVDTFREYDRRNKLGEYAPGEDRGAIPGATPDNIAFDMDTGTGAFGSEIQGPRMTPPQEAAYRSFIQANMGNPNFGPEQVNAFYSSIGLQGADLTGSDAFFEAVRTGKDVGDINYTLTDEKARQDAISRSYAEAPEGSDLSTVGFEKGLGLNLTDELRGGIGGIRSLLSGEGFQAGYQSERDIERALQERSREQNGIVPELAGGLLTPAGILNKTNLARDAVGMGALAGFGEGEGAVDSLAKAGTSAAVGYGAGKVIEAGAPIIANSAIGQRVGSALRGGGEARTKFAEAAANQGIDYMMADAPGGFGSKMMTGVTGMTLGGIPLKAAATKILDKAGKAKEQIAARIGRVGDDAATGQGIQRGLNAWETQTQRRGAEFFDRIPIDKDAPVDLANTRSALSELNNPTSSNAEMSELLRDPKLAKYQKALESGNLSWADTKAFRSRIGEQAGRPAFQQDASKDSLDALYGALTRDIETAASAHSPQAKEAFLRANRYWRGRETRREDVLSQLLGKDRNMNAEATTQQIERWAKEKGGDFNKLARAVRSLPDDEANATRAYVLDRLGTTNRTKMDGSTEEAFSPAVFMQQWGKISPRAKAILFQGEHRKALDDLETVFSGMRASNIFGNPSGTGYSVWGAVTGNLAYQSPAVFAATALGQLGTGALLASPRVAKWFVGLSKKPNPSAQLAHVNQLTAIARAEPVIANDIFTLQEMLAKEFSRSPGAAAAQDSGDGRGEPPAQGERGNAP